MPGDVHCQLIVHASVFSCALLLTVLVPWDVTKCIHLVDGLVSEDRLVHVIEVGLHEQDGPQFVHKHDSCNLFKKDLKTMTPTFWRAATMNNQHDLPGEKVSDHV